MTTCFLAPDPVQSTFFIPGGNTPGNGVQVFFYVAGSSTKQTVYKDPAAAVAWSNPIVLDSGGNLPLGGEVWFPTGQIFKVVWAPSNDSDPPASPYRTMDNLSGMNDSANTVSEWVVGPTPTFVSTTSFTLTGDQTAIFQIGRRVKTVNTGGTVYSRIIGSSFGGALTLVTLANDSGVLDAGISAVSYGFLSATNPSSPFERDLTFRIVNNSDISKQLTFTLSTIPTSTTVNITTTPTGFENVYGPNFSSSALMSLDASAGFTVQDFGTTNVTSIGLTAGRYREVVFQTSKLIQTSATLINVQGNVTTAVGDVMHVVGESSGAARVTAYHGAGNTGTRGASMVLLVASSATNTVNMDLPLTTAFDNYYITIGNAVPTGAAQNFQMQVGTSATIDTGAATYSWLMNNLDTANVSTTFATSAANRILLNGVNTINNSATNGGWSGEIWMHRTNDTSHSKAVQIVGSFFGTLYQVCNGGGLIQSATTQSNPLATVRFSFGAGSTASGFFNLYGIRNT